MAVDARHVVLAGVGAAVAAAAVVVLGKAVRVGADGGSLDYFDIRAFFQSDAEVVQDIAATLPEDEDEFILAAWEFVGRVITYEAVGSDIDFVGEMVSCEWCYSVEETLARGTGNCVAKSSLLSSILLARLPPERVYMVVGHWTSQAGTPSGHAWVQVLRDGIAYLLEATHAPFAPPWHTVGDSPQYMPYAIFSPMSFLCLNHTFCIEVSKCKCCEETGRLV